MPGAVKFPSLDLVVVKNLNMHEKMMNLGGGGENRFLGPGLSGFRAILAAHLNSAQEQGRTLIAY